MRRKAIETRLAHVVRENRFTIAIVFPIVGATVLLGSAGGHLPQALAFHSLLLLFGVSIMRLPLIAGLLPLIDRRAALVLLVLAMYTWTIEWVGVTTGMPYGEFAYGVQLGPMIGDIPIALPLLFIPLVLNAYLFGLLVLPTIAERPGVRVPVAIGLVVAIDLILDPAAVAIGFWSFEGGGLYHDVPWTNYAGWILSGTIAVLAVEFAFPIDSLRRRLETCEFLLDDLVSFVLLWGTINLVVGNVIPVLLTLGFVSGLTAAGRFTPIVHPGSASPIDRQREL